MTRSHARRRRRPRRGDHCIHSIEGNTDRDRSEPSRPAGRACAAHPAAGARIRRARAPPPPPAYGQPAPAYGETAPAYGQPATAYGQPPAAKTNTLAIISLIASIAGIVILWGIGSIAGVICGHISLSQIKKTGEQGRGMAIAGLVIGYAGIVLAIIGIILSSLPRARGSSPTDGTTATTVLSHRHPQPPFERT